MEQMELNNISWLSLSGICNKKAKVDEYPKTLAEMAERE
jgi:hypothetical protein